MAYDPNKHHRRSVRLQGYDYSQNGAYFITLCTLNRECLFGEVVDGDMRLSEYGQIVLNEWVNTSIVRPCVELDEFVIMPNHMHAIVVLMHNVGATRRVAQAKSLTPGSIGAVAAQFKAVATKRINVLRQVTEIPVWQRSYYDHIIRDEPSLNQIREYIQNNPARWSEDRENPANFQSGRSSEPPLQKQTDPGVPPT